MTLLDDIRKVYKITLKCSNCGKSQEANIQKGVTVEDFIKKNRGLCSHCGCSTLVY